MERENMFMNELNCSNFFINSIDQNDPFESALSSMVSSPVNSNAAANHLENSSENIVLRELIGKLGTIYNSGNKSTNTSCYNTPLNSPPKLDLSMVEHQIRGNLPFPGNHLPSHPSLSPLLSTDPGFADRAARFSCFANKSFGGLNGLAPKLESGKLSRVSSYQSGSQVNVEENKDGSLQDGNSVADQKKFTRLSRSCTTENAEFGDSRENSSVSQQISGVNGQNDVNSRKRKSISKGKGKDIPSSTSTKDANAASENNESSAKRSKSKENDKSAEAPKDYIHVRARRGQATDAHSLAERVRREKISQRMKFLQDLVPGCNKVTGKAVMLDEIINYVQSLQRQVEFLSMKLATINPRIDVNVEALMSKDMFQSSGSLAHGTYASDTSVSAFPFQFHSQQITDLHNSIPIGTEMHLSMNHMNAAVEAASQASTFWEDDLQSVVFGQNQTQNVHGGAISKSHMKIEL